MLKYFPEKNKTVGWGGCQNPNQDLHVKGNLPILVFFCIPPDCGPKQTSCSLLHVKKEFCYASVIFCR